jgi:hypothetical protein
MGRSSGPGGENGERMETTGKRREMAWGLARDGGYARGRARIRASSDGGIRGMLALCKLTACPLLIA